MTSLAGSTGAQEIPQRGHAHPHTIGPVPHRQTNQLPTMAQQDALVEALRGVKGMVMDENPTELGFNFDLENPGRRFIGHMHYGQDGTIHITMDPARAKEVYAAGWGEPHPGYPFISLIFAPLTAEEIELVTKLVEEAVAWASANT